MFQFTRPRGARPIPLYGRSTYEVSIHAPTRGATHRRQTAATGRSGFNSRAHAGRDVGPGVVASLRPGFNSRAHAGRDRRLGADGPHRVVSIHAPTRGATRMQADDDDVHQFQFTRPRGARRRAAREARQGQRVSIHAPTRGATRRLHVFGCHLCFNSRAHAGRDQNNNLQQKNNLFQFTRPRGARLRCMLLCVMRVAFQFTRPRGARLRSRRTPQKGS